MIDPYPGLVSNEMLRGADAVTSCPRLPALR